MLSNDGATRVTGETCSPSSFRNQFSNSSKFEKKMLGERRLLVRFNSLLLHAIAIYHACIESFLHPVVLNQYDMRGIRCYTFNQSRTQSPFVCSNDQHCSILPIKLDQMPLITSFGSYYANIVVLGFLKRCISVMSIMGFADN